MSKIEETTLTVDVDDDTLCNVGDSNTAETSVDGRHWDHTNKKVVVHNVLKFLRNNEISKLTSTWLNGHENLGIIISKTKKPPKDNWVKVTLKDEEMVEPFIKLINEGGDNGGPILNAKGKPLFAKKANEMSDRSGGGDDHGDNRKRKNRGDSAVEKDDGQSDTVDCRDAKRANVMRLLSNDEVRDAITPLWRMSYQEQLDLKAREMVNKCCMKIIREIKKKFRSLEVEAKRGHRAAVKPYEWLEGKRAIELQQPIPSPKITQYRNKCEFTCGYHHASQENLSYTTSNGGEKHDEDVHEPSLNEENEQRTLPENDPTITRVPAAGFLAQGWQGGVYAPHCLQNMPDWACSIADILNAFLSTSPMPPYDSKSHRGFFRSFTIRCSLRTKECMIIVVHAPPKGGIGAIADGSDDLSHVFDTEKRRLVEMLTKDVLLPPQRNVLGCNSKEEFDKSDERNDTIIESIRVTSIFFQEYDGMSQPSPDHPVQYVYGMKYLEESLGQCTFQISPGAFFQTNTEGAEKLYNIIVDRIKEVTNNPKETVLLDVCCGTGTIGMTCLKEGVVGKLVGIDISVPAILDAKVNAMKNGFSTHGIEGACDDPQTHFIASPAEKALPEVIKNIPRNSPMVAVVDPARDGLHGIVVQSLRKNERIQRLVYVSCNPTGSLVRDAALLCAPPTKKYSGRPFKPILAQPVDMFPFTNHCELVMTFDRMSEKELEQM